MKGEEHILVNFPIDTSLKKKAHSALISHWFPVEMVHNGPKLCKRKSFFLCWGYPDMPYESWRPANSENVVVLYAIFFLNPSYCCPKAGQISRIFFAKLRCHKKYIWLQYYVSGQIVESAWTHTYWIWDHADSTILPESQCCSPMYYFEDKLKISDSVDFEEP